MAGRRGQGDCDCRLELAHRAFLAGEQHAGASRRRRAVRRFASMRFAEQLGRVDAVGEDPKRMGRAAVRAAVEDVVLGAPAPASTGRWFQDVADQSAGPEAVRLGPRSPPARPPRPLDKAVYDMPTTRVLLDRLDTDVCRPRFLCNHRGSPMARASPSAARRPPRAPRSRSAASGAVLHDRGVDGERVAPGGGGRGGAGGAPERPQPADLGRHRLRQDDAPERPWCRCSRTRAASSL